MKPLSARDRLLRRRLRALERTLPAAQDGEPASVHKARVASRRVREALPVALADAPGKKVKRLAREVRRITRALGPVRELDVTLGVLASAAADHPAAGGSLEAVARDLQADRDLRREDMLGSLDQLRTEHLAGRLRTLATAHAGVSSAVADSVSRAVLAVRIVRRVRALERAVDGAGPLYIAEPLHRVRIATKKLRYALEVADELRLIRSRKPLRALERVQDTLGRLHDVQVLVDRLAAAQATLPAAAIAEANALSTVSAALADECRRLHGDYLAAREPLLSVARQALDTVTAVPARDLETEPVSSSVH